MSNEELNLPSVSRKQGRDGNLSPFKLVPVITRVDINLY